MTPLTLVLCKKAAFEIRPYDSSQTGLLGAGAGALLGGTAAGLGSYALGSKNKKRTSDSLKAALIGALGGGALGGYAGYSYGDDNLKNRILWFACKGDEPYPAEWAGAHGRGLEALKLKLVAK